MNTREFMKELLNSIATLESQLAAVNATDMRSLRIKMRLDALRIVLEGEIKDLMKG